MFDPEVGKGETISFETTIANWRRTRDLLEPKKLAKGYHELYQLNKPVTELEAILSRSNNALKMFCDYLSEHALKQSISPIKIMGQNCTTASIFKALMNNLRLRGIDTQEIRPSSPFIPLFNKHGGIIIAEVAKLAPGSLSKFEYSDNPIVKTGYKIIALSLLSIIVLFFIWHFIG